jgi:hypothetical protein
MPTGVQPSGILPLNTMPSGILPPPKPSGILPSVPKPSGGLRGEFGKQPEGPSNIPPKEGGYSDKLAAISDEKVFRLKNLLKFLPRTEQDLLADCYAENTDPERVFSPDCYKNKFVETVKGPLGKGFSEAFTSEQKNEMKGVGCLKKAVDSFATEGDLEVKNKIVEDIDATVAQQISLNQAISAFATQVISVLNARRRFLLTEVKLMEESAVRKDSDGFIDGFVYTQDEKTSIVKSFVNVANMLYSFNSNLINKVSNIQGMLGGLEKCYPPTDGTYSSPVENVLSPVENVLSPVAPKRILQGQPRPPAPVQPQQGQTRPPSFGQPLQGQPSFGQPQQGQAKPTAPGQPQQGQPSFGQPQQGQAKPTAPGQPQQGQPQQGQPSFGQTQQGQAKPTAPGQPQQGQPSFGQTQQGQAKPTAPGQPQQGQAKPTAPGQPQQGQPSFGQTQQGQPSFGEPQQGQPSFGQQQQGQAKPTEQGQPPKIGQVPRPGQPISQLFPSGVPSGLSAIFPSGVPSVIPSVLPKEISQFLPSNFKPTEQGQPPKIGQVPRPGQPISQLFPSGVPSGLSAIFPSGVPSVIPSVLPKEISQFLPSNFKPPRPPGGKPRAADGRPKETYLTILKKQEKIFQMS